MNLADLKKPFSEVEWRVQSSGISRAADQKPWARVLAYISNRDIQERLDEVCGPEGWSNEYRKGPDGGVLCGISIRVKPELSEKDWDTAWVTKWDGAENTAIESVKGGLSDSMKRAAVQWGIGRYLYKLEAGWAQIVTKGTKNAHSGKVKGSNEYFYWLPPELPSWALPGTTRVTDSGTTVTETDSSITYTKTRTKPMEEAAKEVFDGEEVEAKPNPNRERCKNGIERLYREKIIDGEQSADKLDALARTKDGDLEVFLGKIKNEYRNGKIVLETEFKDDDSSASLAHYKKGFEGKELF